MRANQGASSSFDACVILNQSRDEDRQRVMTKVANLV